MTYINVKEGSGGVKPALLFSHCQWAGLYGTVNRARDLEAEARDRGLELEERKELSRRMADTWENTYINIRKQRYEKRKERLLKEQKYKEKRYEELRIESEKAKKEICDKAKKVFFFERDACKALHSAFRTSEVEAERLAQLEFQKKLRKVDREIETKYAESILSDAQRYHEEQEEEKRKLQENKMTLKSEAKQMLKAAEERKALERERVKQEEKADMELMARQLQQVADNEKYLMQQKKLFERNNLIENRETVQKYKQQQMEEDEEENKALEIIANGKMIMSKIRKEREEEMMKANRLRLEQMSKKLSTEAEERQRKEEESLKRAADEKYKIEIDTKEKQRQYQEMLKKERIQEHLKYMKEAEEMLLREKELMKWEVLRRFEREERNKEFGRKLKEQRRRRAQEVKDQCVKQTESDIDKRMKEKQVELEACQRSQELWELSDKEFLGYAMAVREESRKKGRPLYPLDAAIYSYKRNHGLNDKQRNFIWDSKLKRPKGIEQGDCQDERITQVQNCLTVETIPREDCGCPKKANGLT